MRRGRVPENHQGRRVLLIVGRTQEELKMACHTVCKAVRTSGIEAIF